MNKKITEWQDDAQWNIVQPLKVLYKVYHGEKQDTKFVYILLPHLCRHKYTQEKYRQKQTKMVTMVVIVSLSAGTRWWFLFC